MKKETISNPILTANSDATDKLIIARLSTEFALIDAGIIMSDANSLIGSLITSFKNLSNTEVLVKLNALSEVIYTAQLALAKGNESALWQSHEYPTDEDIC